MASLSRPVPRRTVTHGRAHLALAAFSLGLALYHLIAPLSWLVSIDSHLIVHLGCVLAMTFVMLGVPASRPAARLVDAALVVASLAMAVYFVGGRETLLARAVVITTLLPLQIGASGLLMLLLLEAARRSVGLPFVVIIGGFLLLMAVGPYLPGIWRHPGMSAAEILDMTVWTRLQGIWGIPLRMSATLISLFFIFGKLMQYSGLGHLLTSLCFALAGGTRGGLAKVAVIGSALVGSVTAGPATNLLMTGTLTIPMMKESGYRADYAGAVEAAASTGASIVPPVMTGIVFIMAELTGTPYSRIMVLAVIPAVLYYICLLLQVHFQAIHTGLRGTGKGPDLVRMKQELAARGHLLLPVLLLVVLLLRGYYPASAIIWAIPSVPLSAALRSNTRMPLRLIVRALVEASQELVRVAPVCALSGIVIVALFQTGLGSAFSHVVSAAAGQSLLLLALMGAAACLVLGMGVPPTPAYLMTVLIVAPLMVKSGLPVLVAHFFSLYYANLAFITPPIAIGSFVAAGISGADFWRLSGAAVRLASVGFAIPLVFVYRPALLLFGDPLSVVWAVAACSVLVMCLAAAFEGWMLTRLPMAARVLLLGAALALIPPNVVANLVALVTVGVVFVLQRAALRAAGEAT